MQCCELTGDIALTLIPPDAQTPDTLVTVKGSPENVDRACETINQVFAQAKAHRVASKQSK